MLLRDTMLTGAAYLKVDLAAMLDGQLFEDFATADAGELVSWR